MTRSLMVESAAPPVAVISMSADRMLSAPAAARASGTFCSAPESRVIPSDENVYVGRYITRTAMTRDGCASSRKSSQR